MWKRQQTRAKPSKGRLWLVPERAQEEDEPAHNHYLDLADIALGLTKPQAPMKKPAASARCYALEKTEQDKKS